MPPTILSELARRNPEVNNSGTKPGTNTISADWPQVESWTLWQDFNAATLYELYRDVVDKTWHDPQPHPKGTRFDLEIFDEDSLEHNILSKLLLPPVNDALRYARRLLGKDNHFDLDIGRSGRCYYNPSRDSRYHPDWALCSLAETVNNDTYANLLPGDTKISKKWASSDYTNEPMAWTDPVRQTLSYCNKTAVRYGFIITEMELVVFRCTREKIGVGIGANRPSRTSQAILGHSRIVSVDTDISAVSGMLQSVSLSSAYQATESGIDFLPVEYRAIPWSNHGDGKKRLTVRLGLFYLAMLAGYGPTSIQTEYPTFDSWFYGDDGMYHHNTTGIAVKKKPHRAILQYPDPATSGPRWITFDDADYLTRSSVRTLEFDGQQEQYFFIYEENRVYITEDTVIYDEDAQQWGYFRGLAWIEAKEGEPSKKRRKKK